MTGDTTPISDEAITRLIKAFYEAHGVESWESSAEYRSGAEHHWMREAFAEIAPLLVSAEAERRDEFPEHLIAQRDEAQAHLAEAEREVEGLRGEMDSERTARARDLVRYSQDAMFLRLNAAEADRDAAEAALAQLTSITPLATPVGGQEKPNDVHKPFTDDGVTYCGWDGHEGCGEVWPCSTVRAAAPVGGQHVSAVEAEPSDDGWDTCEHGVMGDHYFVEDTEWGVNHHYCPGRRHTAAAVSGEHQDATEDAQ